MMHEEKPKPADADQESGLTEDSPIKILLVDDEERFRRNLAERLSLRGFEVQDAGDPEDAVRIVRQMRPDVILLDRKMPKMQGEEVLKEVKRISPETQVIMLTGHASMSSAASTGRLGAFAYLEKPCETEGLIATIKAARQEKIYAMARHEIPQVQTRSILSWLWGTYNFRPGIMALGVLIFAALVLMPTPAKMISLLSLKKETDRATDPIAGYADYRKMDVGQTITTYFSTTFKLRNKTAEAVAFRAKVMVGTLAVAALFWASGALPIGFTALLVGALMILFGVFDPNKVAQAYAKDAVVFIMGVLALSVAIAKTGLDRRIGLLLLGTSRSLTLFLLLFCPLLAVSASFFSEHALVAFITPILMVVYKTAVRASGLKSDRALAVLFILGVCFVANQGGPGSPAAGGRNAVMVGILADYGGSPSFAQWVKYGLPFVPVMALAIALYFLVRLVPRIKCRKLNIAAVVRKEAEKLGRWTREEYIAAVVLAGVIVMWITGGEGGGGLGMGGPVLIGLVVLAALRIIGWREINRISWDVVALYASACAMGTGLATTGAALWLASGFTLVLPESLSRGDGLAVASSLFTGILTNFMSDGATVSALGPVAVPMATLSGSHPWKVGLATAFSSSFANCLIIGTPNNAIAYSLAKDLDTGEQLVTLSDFLKHGVVVTLLAFLVLWFWTIYGYWHWIGGF